MHLIFNVFAHIALRSRISSLHLIFNVFAHIATGLPSTLIARFVAHPQHFFVLFVLVWLLLPG